MAAKKKSVKKTAGMSNTMLMWLSIFFVLVAVFVVMMYYKQVQDVDMQDAQQAALQQKLVATPTPKATVKPIVKPTVKPAVKK
ncbi:MAG TPA: hypothetical protein VLH19_00735 [Patescibacteria group bacterium]|nr:hypothetical protein [Patescibacteria group bacterium]